jgi:chemotaxis response regulator CheB
MESRTGRSTRRLGEELRSDMQSTVADCSSPRRPWAAGDPSIKPRDPRSGYLRRACESVSGMPQNRPSQAKSGRSRSNEQVLLAREPPHGAEDFPVVGIGASAGGLEACTKLLGALPPNNGMAFILVQHLDPTHESMMAELLAYRTAMTVVQAPDASVRLGSLFSRVAV